MPWYEIGWLTGALVVWLVWSIGSMHIKIKELKEEMRLLSTIVSEWRELATGMSNSEVGKALEKLDEDRKVTEGYG